MATTSAKSIHVQGIVQGVGFRPYVYRLAIAHNLAGWVLNANDGVHIFIQGQKNEIDQFVEQLPLQAPSAAKITDIQVTSQAVGGLVQSIGMSIEVDPVLADFEIRESRSAIAIGLPTFISPDLATCDDCLRELFDSNNRRYHYPFINCTNCGPRFTIIQDLPYDRPYTSMAAFEMCSNCAKEYGDPANRRFHAQPDACFECGPELSFWDATDDQTDGGRPSSYFPPLLQSDAIIEQAVGLLAQGGIVAIKGLGGYHLACNATNEQAVQMLRQRKRRSNKPLAVMFQSLDQVQQYCIVTEAEAAALQSPAHPIVLLQTVAPLAASVVLNLPELGVMLPYTPLQHLLMAAFGGPLVMTSGNISEEPIIGQDSQAHQLLADVADAFIDNNRPIISRYDDSVVRVLNNRLQMVRRARGYAPKPLQLPTVLSQSKTILAYGPEQKSTFCLTSQNTAFISQHLGDLDNANTFSNYLSTLQLYQQLFKIEPEVLVCDKHPEYLSSKQAFEQAEQRNLPLIKVQHHHAHIAAVIGENCGTETDSRGLISEASRKGNAPAGPSTQIIGVAFDGTGYGDDGNIWGGEVLIASMSGFERFAHLRYLPLPGGEAAIKHPDRLAYALLYSLGLLEHPGAQALSAKLSVQDKDLLMQMVSRQLNTPQTSSMGRLFDAVSALCGICCEATYDGEPAIALEAAISPGNAQTSSGSKGSFSFGPVGAGQLPCRDNCLASIVPLEIDYKPVILVILEALAAGKMPAVIAQEFHDAVAAMIVDVCQLARDKTGINIVALSGGVFMNRYLGQTVPSLLEQAGFTVWQHHNLPANDGCIAYGQAVVATAQLQEQLD